MKKMETFVDKKKDFSLKQNKTKNSRLLAMLPK